jgi:hypothetical protein
VAIRFGVSSTVKNRLPKYSNFWDGTAVYNPFSPTGSYDALASYTISSGTLSSITFSGLPTGGQYTHLQLRGVYFNTGLSDVYCKLNTNTGLKQHYLNGSGTSASSGSSNSTANGLITDNGQWTTSNPTIAIIDILDYANVNKYKTIRTLGGQDNNGGSAGIWLSSGLFDLTSAVTSITLTPDNPFTTGTVWSLYGIRG